MVVPGLVPVPLLMGRLVASGGIHIQGLAYCARRLSGACQVRVDDMPCLGTGRAAPLAWGVGSGLCLVVHWCQCHLLLGCLVASCRYAASRDWRWTTRRRVDKIWRMDADGKSSKRLTGLG